MVSGITPLGKGGFFVKIKFFELISGTFEFSRQNEVAILTEIDNLACLIWLKVKFSHLELSKIYHFRFGIL